MDSSEKTPTFALHLRKTNDDSLAQLVEHNTFNVGVLGSSPRRITSKTLKIKQLDAKSDCLFSFIYFRLQHSFTSSVNRDVNRKPNERNH